MDKYDINILSKMLSNKQKNLYKKFGETNIMINNKSYIQVSKRDLIYRSFDLHDYATYLDYLNSQDSILNKVSYEEYSFSLLSIPTLFWIDNKLLDKILIKLKLKRRVSTSHYYYCPVCKKWCIDYPYLNEHYYYKHSIINTIGV